MTMNTLKDLYIDQLQDIYSANRQALGTTKALHQAASSDHLRNALDAGVKGIEQGMAQVKGVDPQPRCRPARRTLQGHGRPRCRSPRPCARRRHRR